MYFYSLEFRFHIIFSAVTSNNAQVRCNFVDLYYSLFGSKVPNCLAKNETPLTSGLPKIPKISKTIENKRSASPFDNVVPAKPNIDEPVDQPETFKREREREPEPTQPTFTNKPFEVKEEPAESIKVSLFIRKIRLNKMNSPTEQGYHFSLKY